MENWKNNNIKENKTETSGSEGDEYKNYGIDRGEKKNNRSERLKSARGIGVKGARTVEREKIKIGKTENTAGRRKRVPIEIGEAIRAKRVIEARIRW